MTATGAERRALEDQVLAMRSTMDGIKRELVRIGRLLDVDRTKLPWLAEWEAERVD